MSLCPHLCAALNFISYDKRHDARPVPSDGNPIALTPMFCLSESDTFYLYPIRLTTGQNGTQGQVRVPKSNKVQHISGRSPVPMSSVPCMERIMWLLLEVSGPYFASGELESWRRVRFQGCSPLSSQPPSRKFCLKWLTAVTPTLRGSRSLTSFKVSSLAFLTSFSMSFASIVVYLGIAVKSAISRK